MGTDYKPTTAPAASTPLSGAELIPCAQGGASKAITASSIADLPSPPSGVAGGDLSGSYPIPEVATVYGGELPVSGSVGATDNQLVRVDVTGVNGVQPASPLFGTDAGVLAVGGVTSSFPGIYHLGSGKLGLVKANLSGFCTSIGNDFQAPDDTTPKVIIDTQLQLASDSIVGWHNTTNARTGSIDTGFARTTAGVVAVTNGSGSSNAWIQWAGQSYLAADATNATTTLANTGLSVTVKSGRKYGFKCILFVSDSVAAEGAKIDFGGGSATATNFRAHVTGFDTALTINTQLTSLSGVASAGTFTGSGMIEVHGSLEPGSDGTFIPRFAQASHAAGTLTLFRGSHILMWDLP